MLFRAITGAFFDSHTKQIRVNASVAICTVSYDTAVNTGSSELKSKRSWWLRLVIRTDKERMANKFFRVLQQIRTKVLSPRQRWLNDVETSYDISKWRDEGKFQRIDNGLKSYNRLRFVAKSKAKK